MRTMPSAFQRVELISALLSGGVGLAAWLLVLFGPLYRTSASAEASGLAAEELTPRAFVILLVFLLCLVGVTAGAILHAYYRISVGLRLLCIAALLLLGGVLLTSLSIGGFLTPAALLALAAAIAAVLGVGRLR